MESLEIRHNHLDEQVPSGVWQNLTEHQQTEAALRESQRRLASLMNSLPGIVFSCTPGPQWSMTYLSAGCLTLTGYGSQELIGQDLSFC